MEKDLTTSVFTFEDLIQGNFLYVDKTEYIWRLIRPAKGEYFQTEFNIVFAKIDTIQLH